MILGHVTKGHGLLLWVVTCCPFWTFQPGPRAGSKTDFLLGMVWGTYKPDIEIGNMASIY
jgi:hypothetical protein